MENMEKDLENKFCLYVNNLAINNVILKKYSPMGEFIDFAKILQIIV